MNKEALRQQTAKTWASVTQMLCNAHRPHSKRGKNLSLLWQWGKVCKDKICMNWVLHKGYRQTPQQKWVMSKSQKEKRNYIRTILSSFFNCWLKIETLRYRNPSSTFAAASIWSTFQWPDLQRLHLESLSKAKLHTWWADIPATARALPGTEMGSWLEF